MPNPYFNNFTNAAEQNLIEDLVVESISMYGHGCQYLVRNTPNIDEIYGEDSLATFTKAYDIDLYIRSYDNYQGDGVFLSKFNLEIRDVLTVSIAIRSFNNSIAASEPTIKRPREGDLVFLPMDNRLYQITYVNKTAVFYQTGALQFYDMSLELFEYSSERFDTGIDAIDNIYRDRSLDLNNYSILTQDGFMITDESGYPIIQGQYSIDAQNDDFLDDSDEIQTESDAILDWEDTDPFSEGQI